MRKGEEKYTKEILSLFNTFYLNKEISRHFLEIMSNKHIKRTFIPDALIAATCISIKLQLYTLNRKDFVQIPGLVLYKPAPIRHHEKK